eukprot:3337441-Prymnesium_polylepis.1
MGRSGAQRKRRHVGALQPGQQLLFSHHPAELAAAAVSAAVHAANVGVCHLDIPRVSVVKWSGWEAWNEARATQRNVESNASDAAPLLLVRHMSDPLQAQLWHEQLRVAGAARWDAGKCRSAAGTANERAAGRASAAPDVVQVEHDGGASPAGTATTIFS